MEAARLRPRTQIFVCTNERTPTDPLTSACGRAGPDVYNAVKREVAAAGRIGDLWVTRTGCLGHCPPQGCAVVVYPSNQQFINVTAADAKQIAAVAVASPGISR